MVLFETKSLVLSSALNKLVLQIESGQVWSALALIRGRRIYIPKRLLAFRGGVDKIHACMGSMHQKPLPGSVLICRRNARFVAECGDSGEKVWREPILYDMYQLEEVRPYDLGIYLPKLYRYSRDLVVAVSLS